MRLPQPGRPFSFKFQMWPTYSGVIMSLCAPPMRKMFWGGRQSAVVGLFSKERRLQELQPIIDRINQTFEAKSAIRNDTLARSRELIRHCANSIRATQRGDDAEAQTLLQTAREVAAEMIALRSGLGYMIMDSRNAGNRYDLVIAGMIIIGVIGLLLDGLMRSMEAMKSVRWRYDR